jgi:hypothetical protein
MSGELSFAEVDGQRVELLPARTVLSLFSSTGGSGGSGAGSSGTGVTGGTGGTGGAGSGWAAIHDNSIYIEGDMINTLYGGVGGAADGGAVSSGGAPAGATGGAGATGS